MAVRLAFALSFIVIVWVLAWVIEAAIPHRPEKVRLLQRHEQYLHEVALLKATAVGDEEDNVSKSEVNNSVNNQAFTL